MKRPWFVPSPIALVSAVLLFMLLGVLGVVAAAIVPWLFELMRTSPRAAMIGFLGLALSPAVLVTMVHHVGHRALDGVDRHGRGAGVVPKVESLWAGAHALLVLYGTSVLTSLVILVIHPPELEPDAFAWLAGSVERTGFFPRADLGTLASLRTVVWIVLAAELYELERLTRRGRSTGG